MSEEWFILNATQAAQVAAWSAATEFKAVPRKIDNPLALNLDPLILTLTLGKSYALPVRVSDDPEYGPYWKTKLAGMPRRRLQTSLLFMPPEG